MKLRSFIVTFGSFVLTTGLFYLIGHAFKIPWLMFQHEYTDTANGLFVKTGSLVPLLIGLVVCFFTEKIYLYKYR